MIVKRLTGTIIFAVTTGLSLSDVYAQTPKADSLKKIVALSQLDSSWFAAIFNLSLEMSNFSTGTEGFDFSRKMHAIAGEQGDTLNLSKAEEAIAHYYTTRNQFDSAIYHSLEVLKYSEQTKDSVRFAGAICDLSRLYFILGDYEKSLRYALEGLELFEVNAIGDPICVYGQLATTYSYIGDQETAQKYFGICIEIYESQLNPNLRQLEAMHTNRGASYFFMKEYEKAIESYKKALELSYQIGAQMGVAVSLINIGEAYSWLGNYAEASDYLNKGLALAEEGKDRYVVSSALYMLSDMYSARGDYKKAFEIYKTYVSLKDSLFSLEKSNQIARMQTLYETERKEKDILELRQEKQQAAVELEEQQNRNLLFGGSALVFLFISGGVILGYLKLKEAKKEVDRRNALITDINRRLNASQDALLLSNKTKDKFFALIAHDLRGPVTSLSGIGKLLHFNLRKGRMEKVEELISQIDGSAVKVNHLLDNLLKWALSQTGALSYRPENVNLQQILEDCNAVFVDVAKAKEIVVRLEVDDDVWVLADHNMLSTVLRNLVSNALKFTAAGGTVTLKAERLEGAVNLSVEDSGVGVPPELVKKIARKEALASTQGTDGETGTGLGLVLCQEFVQMHGSQLSVTSSSQGSVFSFSLASVNVSQAIVGA